MTAQILSTELSNLIQESKRKNTELRTAAEKSLNDLKALPSTSEAQLAADLNRRPDFISPFLIACSTRNARFAGIAVVCLQRLVVSRGLPKERLKEVVEAFRESTSLGLDIQLKILQALPSLLQNYPQDLTGDLLSNVLHVCTILQSSKTAVVNNTAAAALQQLMVSVFDQVVTEDKSAEQIATVAEAPTKNGPVPVRAAALDALRVFDDLCLLIDGEKPQFLRTSSMQHTFGLELIESVLTNHADIFRSHPEQAHVLQTRLMPFIIKSLSDRSSFPASVRVFRVLYNVLKCHLSMLASECEAAISLLTHLLDPETAAPWKRALCMEVFRGVHTEPGLVRKIYAHFDEQHGRKNVLKDHMAALARLAAEKPTVIGIGQQSTVPVHPAQSRDSSSEQAAIEAGGVAGVIGAAVGMTELNVPGISVQWSSMRVPCIDQLDKSDPPNLPESYIYSLTLTCVNSFSEGLAKFILPLTIPSDSRGKRRHKMPPIQELDTPSESNGVDPASSNPRQELPRTSPLKRTQLPVNPLTLTSHPQHGEIKTSAAMIEACWPAVLATSSTFLYASLDSDYYHSLVRSFQKFTHVAGLLRLGTPRDAFLTTLGKAAVPAGILTANIAATPATPAGEGQGLFENAMGLLSVDSLVSQAPSVASDKHKQAMDVNPIFLNARNLLCLRALLNLGIALGSTLGQAWSIVLETIQQADLIISVYNRRTGRQSSFTGQRNDSRTKPEGPSLLANLGTEITAVETAASRMFESTGEYPNESFLDFIAAMCKLLRNVDLQSKVTGLKFTAAAPSSPTIAVHTHRRLPSISGLSTSSTAQSEEDQFILSKLGDVASINISRLTSHRPSDSGWDVIVEELVAVASSMQMDSVIRLKAAEVLNGLVLSAFSYVQSQPARLHNDVQRLGLSALSAEIRALYDGDGEGSRAVHGVDMEIHRLSLDTLKSILEQYGEALVAGWEIVFDVVSSVFDGTESVSSDEEDQDHARSFEQLQKCATKSPKLVRSSFDSLRLICSDFLSSLSSSCMLMLIDTLYRFCSQTDDFNISLTTTAFFWNVSDFLQSINDELDLDSHMETVQSFPKLVETASNKNLQTATPALWLFLQVRLSAVTTDQRLEVRNGAVHTVLRIFDAFGDKLTPNAWKLCLQTIIFKMMEANEMEYTRLRVSKSRGGYGESKAWNRTTMIMIQGVGKLFATFLESIMRQETFAVSWRSLLRYLEAYLERQSLEVCATVFQALRQILSKFDGTNRIGKPSVDLIWNLWATGNPALVQTFDNADNNNLDALIAYIQSFSELYQLIEADLTFERVEIVLENLRTCLSNSVTSTYSADIDILTLLQAQVLDCIQLVRADIPGVPSILICLLADIVSKPYRESPPMPGVRQSSFVAISKAAMDLLQSYITRHKRDRDLFTSGALTKSIEALVIPLDLKYKWRLEGKQPSTWRKATSTAIAVLEEALPVIENLAVDEEIIQELWSSIVKVTNGIAAADCPLASPSADILADEDFDFSAFTRLRNLVTPNLGSTLISDKTRQTYTSSIFTNSIIHTPHRQDLPLPNQEPLDGLYATHMGRTYDPPPTRRSKMSYMLIDELFALVAVHHDADRSPERIKLAQAAAPFLILRAAIVLKAYIADQPLRGRMPQLMSQKRELIYIVRKLVELDSEPRAIPDTQGVTSEYKKHLHRLFPLVTRAIGVAGRDEMVLAELQRVLEVVGEGFGVG